MARPERIRKIQLRVLIPVIASAMFWDGCPMRCETKTTTQAITTTTIVLMAVARFDSTPSIPILARIAVAAANTADRLANMSHIFFKR